MSRDARTSARIKIAICSGKTRKSRIIAENDQNRSISREMAKIAVYRGKLQKIAVLYNRDKFLPLIPIGLQNILS